MECLRVGGSASAPRQAQQGCLNKTQPSLPNTNRPPQNNPPGRQQPPSPLSSAHERSQPAARSRPGPTPGAAASPRALTRRVPVTFPGCRRAAPRAPTAPPGLAGPCRASQPRSRPPQPPSGRGHPRCEGGAPGPARPPGTGRTPPSCPCRRRPGWRGGAHARCAWASPAGPPLPAHVHLGVYGALWWRDKMAAPSGGGADKMAAPSSGAGRQNGGAPWRWGWRDKMAAEP